jgi:hypothetical protein
LGTGAEFESFFPEARAAMFWNALGDGDQNRPIQGPERSGKRVCGGNGPNHNRFLKRRVTRKTVMCSISRPLRSDCGAAPCRIKPAAVRHAWVTERSWHGARDYNSRRTNSGRPAALMALKVMRVRSISVVIWTTRKWSIQSAPCRYHDVLSCGNRRGGDLYRGQGPMAVVSHAHRPFRCLAGRRKR